MADENKTENQKADPTTQEAGETRPLFGGIKQTAPQHTDEVVDKPAEAGLARASVEPVADSDTKPFDVEASEAAALHSEEREDDRSVSYSAPSVPNFRIGPYQFEKGVLNLTPEDAEKFDKLISQTSPSIQSTVFKVDREAGEAVARRFQELNGGRMIQGGETTGQTPNAPNPADQQHKA